MGNILAYNSFVKQNTQAAIDAMTKAGKKWEKKFIFILKLK